MSKAEERALEAYPPKMRYVGIDSVKDDRKIDVNKPMRDRYVKAYHQAEKDLELTWEDIADILDVTDVIANDDSMEERLKTMSEEEYCQEVLKRFKDFKERK